MSGRNSVTVTGLEHGTNPIPSASRIGPLVATGAIQGWDRTTRELPIDLSNEVDMAFDNLASVLDAAGAGLDNVVHLDVYAGVDGLRHLLNDTWLRHFPHEEFRPTRHVIRQDLPAGMRVQVKAIAYVESSNDRKRQ